MKNIHLHVEIRLTGETYEFGVWHHWSAPVITPNAQIFNKLTQLVQIRGLPVDCSKPTLLDYINMANDAYDATWMLQNEIEELSGWLVDKLPPQAENNPHYSLENDFIHSNLFGEPLWYNQIDKGVSDVRFVFWFNG